VKPLPAVPVAGIPALAWLRIGLRMAAIAALLIACIPLYYACQLLGISNPWPRRFLGGLARIAGVSIRVSGDRPGGGEFLLANHVSWIDVPAIAAASGTAFVARHDRTSVHRQVEQVRQAIRDTGLLAIFPEGTTSDGTGLLPFKSSLLSALEPLPAGIVVRPVALDYGSESRAIAWTGSEPGTANFKRILARKRPIVLNVRFLPILSGEALANRKTIAAAAQTAILRALESKLA
jgi:1-acyl-sn-glycerol-3-phosphate acyltransferase